MLCMELSRSPLVIDSWRSAATSVKTSLRTELLAWTAFVFSVINPATCFIASKTSPAVLLEMVETGIIFFCTGDLRGFGLPDLFCLRAGGGFFDGTATFFSSGYEVC